MHYDLDPMSKRHSNQHRHGQDVLKTVYPFVQRKEFNYSAYPKYFNVEVASGEYAWKPVIVEKIVSEAFLDAHHYSLSFVYFIDAGSIIANYQSLKKDFKIARDQGMYSPFSTYGWHRWNHKGTAEYLEWFNAKENDRLCSGGRVLIDVKNKTI